MHLDTLIAGLGKSNLGMNSSGGKSLSSLFSKRALSSCVIAASLFLTACSQTDDETPIGQVGAIKGFFGAVSTDEPNAALVGREVLSAGGTAADAAVAMSFVLSATYPSRAGLGAGGVCLVHDGAIGLTEVLDFTGKAGSLKTGDRASAVPGLVRGMAALHSRYGALDWRQLVLPAEKVARYGHRISRAARKDIALAERPLLLNAPFRAVFSKDGSSVIPEGSKLEQVDLAAAFSQIRVKGAGAFYQGPYARQVVASIQAAGGNISEEDMRDFLPSWKGLLGVSVRDYTVYFAEPPAGGGAVSAQTLAMIMGEDERYLNSSEEERSHLLVEALKRAYKKQQEYITSGWDSKLSNDELMQSEMIASMIGSYDSSKTTYKPLASVRFTENPYNTGFVVVDRNGTAAACDISLNNLFGTGRMAPGMGFMVAASPNTRSRNPLNLGPMLVASSFNGNFVGAAAGAGSSFKKSSMLSSLLDIAFEEQNMIDSFNKPRIGLSADLNTVLVEQGGEDVAESLSAKGHQVKISPIFSRLNMVYCRYSLPRSDSKRNTTDTNCSSATDQRGHGLSLMAVE